MGPTPCAQSNREGWPRPFVAFVLAGLGLSVSCSGRIEPDPLPVGSETPCDAEERRCNGDLLEKCSADGAAFELVGQCNPGSCNPVTLACDVCTAGHVDCADESTVRVCSDDGLRETLTPCESSAPHCLAGAGRCAVCVPASSECVGDKSRRACDPDGQWQAAAQCPTGETCSLGECTDKCREGDQRCVPDVDHYEICGPDGDWSLPVDCGTGSATYWDVCREGLCVDSPEYAVGNDDVGGWDTTKWDANTLILVPLRVNSNAKLFALEVITAAGGGFVKLALWEDASGYPARLIASTKNASVVTGAERVTRFPTPTLPALAAQQTYWIGAVFSTEQTLYTRANGGPDTLVHPYAFAGNFLDIDPFPASAAPGSGLDFGISLQVKDLL